MTLAPGDRVGPYELLSPLGSGGMGSVYRAKDMRLDRDVALKVLHDEVAGDASRLKRFENEARSASALSHPNIVTIYDIGTSDSVSWIAMERVDGTTLSRLISAGPVPIRKLLNVAVQIADGLAGAHSAGIVHRDLKPENVMLTRDHRVKIVDFGLAKLAPTGSALETAAATATFPGTLLGTVGYMSPEQAGGQPADFRSDQFSFGSILYEMATGRRAFQKSTSVDTLSSILHDEPEPLASANGKSPAFLALIVARCLAKDPAERYASTEDLARDLAFLNTRSAESADLLPERHLPRRRKARLLWGGAAVILAALVAVFLAGRNTVRHPIPDFQRVTFGHGAVWSARFAPDGRTIVYGAAWDGAPIRLFTTRTDGRESAGLKLPDADLLSVSTQGEIAILLDRPLEPVRMTAGTLARVPLAGGAPREVAEGVAAADWSPNGKSLAIARKIGEKQRLEFPIGTVLYETTGWIESLRVSPGGDAIAFLVRRSKVSVETVDLSGKHRVLSEGWKRGSGLAWSSDGREVWFAANEQGWQTPLYAVTLAGRLRMVMRLPSWIGLQDVSRDGRVLLSLVSLRSSMRGMTAGETRERDLSWHEGSLVRGITPDGKTLLFDEGGESYFHTLYVRPMDGSPAKRIGEGRSMAISADGRWVLSNAAGRGSSLVLLPTGAGEPRPLKDEGHKFEDAAFFPDGSRALLVARDPGHADRSYVLDLRTEKLRLLAPEGFTCSVLSPDGKDAACQGQSGEGTIVPVEGGPARPIPGFQGKEGDLFLWSADRSSLFTSVGMKVFRLDLTTGRSELWREFTPADRAALIEHLYQFAMTPDGKSYAFSCFYLPSDLYLLTGLTSSR